MQKQSKPQQRAIEKKQKEDLIQDMHYTDQLTLLRKTTGICDEDIEDYQKTEVLRKAVADVRSRANDQEDIRNSPTRYYSSKSKVAGNIRSIKKTKKRGGQIVLEDEHKNFPQMMDDAQRANYDSRCQEIQQQSQQLQQLPTELQNMKVQAKYNSEVRMREAATRRAQSAANDKKKSSAPQKRNTTNLTNGNQNPMGFSINDVEPNIDVSFGNNNTKTKKGRQSETSSFLMSGVSPTKTRASIKIQPDATPQKTELRNTNNIYEQRITEEQDCNQDQDWMPVYKPAIDEEALAKLQLASQSIEKADLQVLKNIAKPPQIVVDLMKTVALLDGRYEDPSFADAKKVFIDIKIMNKLKAFDVYNVTKQVAKKVQKSVNQNEFDADKVKNCSGAACGLATWILAVNECLCQLYNLVPLRPVQKQDSDADLPLYQSPNRMSQTRAKSASTAQKKRYAQRATAVNADGIPTIRPRNPELEEKTKQVQEEFARLMQEKDYLNGQKYEVQHNDDFYQKINDFYKGVSKYDSPNKRLVAQKNTTVEHKTMLKQNFEPGQDYRLSYFADPTKSYVMEPKDGEINYSKAFKKSEEFYDEVLNADINQTKVRKNKEQQQDWEAKKHEARQSGVSPGRKTKIPLEMSQKVTKRKNARVMEAVKAKIGLVFMERLGITGSNTQVLTAMDNPEIQIKINEKMDNKEIKLVDNNRQTLYTNDPAELANADVHMTQDAALEIQEQLQREITNQKLAEIELKIAEEVDSLWKHYDADNNGYLQKDEAKNFVQQMIAGMGCDFKNDEFEECFQELDADHNNIIEKKEMAKFIKAVAGLK